MNADKIRNELSQYIGTENLYSHPLNRNIVYTDGAKAFADKLGAHWLLDLIVTTPTIQRYYSVVVFVDVEEDSTAEIKFLDGDWRRIHTQPMEFTTLPHGSWEIWRIDNTILLPSEY